MSAPTDSAPRAHPGAAATLFAELPSAHPSNFRQWRALSGRIVRTMATKGELIVAVITPLVFTLGFYLPLRFVMKFQGVDYAQFVMPIIVLQTMAFTMMSNAQLAAFEALTGFSTRLQTMPIGALVPLSARIAAGLVRSVTSLVAALVFGYLIGFRFVAGFGQAVAFCAFALAVGTVLAIGADALGSLTKSPESLSQALTLPTLIFGMLSCGFVPERNFPEWIRPFVRNQPISQFSFALRDMTADGVSWQVLWVPLVWLGGLAIVLVPLAIWASVRRS
ncbi:ABC transporter permease [Nocardia callitridis]|uniref:Antibiotic transporter n=1 Tax=Nocardia callitridis TaxID=648753 RepID=A0ABP9JVE4_9NOCA